MKDKISIIVAIYNTEKYIEKCLSAILNQTYKNIELIIIEDKSTDNSKKIISKYSSNKNIKIFFNETNKGLAYSRNRGLENATGEYVGFIDSDDYIQENYYELLLSSLKKENADIAVCDMKLVYEETNDEVIIQCCDSKQNKISFINNGLAASACNKLFKKRVIDKYRFEVGKVNEDIAVVISAMADSKKITYTENCYYNYYQRSTSIQNSKFKESRFDIFDGVKLLSNRIKKNKQYKNIISAVAYQQLFMFFLYVIPKEKNIFKRSKYLRKFKKLSKDYDLLNNEYCINDLNGRGKKAKFYYRLIYKLNEINLSLLASIFIEVYSIFRSIKYSRFMINRLSVIKRNITIDSLVKCAKKQTRLNSSIKISVVVPNYNYEDFLLERLYSILNQKYKIFELIILDDCSKDNSKELIKKIVKKICPFVNVKTIYNEKNSGSAFKQWEKGFVEAQGDFVWIAEADDYCEKTLLSKLVKPIEYDNEIVISYADTTFINKEGLKKFKTIKKEIDIQNTGHWNKDYINDGKDEIEKYVFLNNTIANVSGCIIKNNNYTKYFTYSKKYKQSGDWLLYANIMYNGKIAYTNRVLNYYREHGNNISSLTKKELHIKEILSIYDYFIKKFDLNKNHKEKMNKRINYLKKQWGVSEI